MVAAAWTIACSQAALDLASRQVGISAVPALGAFHLALVLAAVLLAILAARRVDARLDGHADELPAWPLLVSLAATGIVVTGRLATSTTAPTVGLVSPVLLVAPSLLTFQLVARYRAGRRMRPAALERFAAAWCTIGAVAVLALAAGPTGWNQVDIRASMLQAVGASIVTVAAAGCAGAALWGPRRVVTRFGFVAAAGAVATYKGPGFGEPIPWWVPAAAAAMLGALYLPGPRMHRRVFRRRSAAVGATQLRRAFSAFVGLPRRGARTLGGAWRAVLRASAPDAARNRPALARRDRIGAAVMGLGSLGYVASGWAWAAREGWQPTGHAAVLMSMAHDVGTVHHPLVGIGTDFGVGGSAHPGPMVLDLLAPLVRLFGIQQGARVGAALVVLTCWTVAVWSAWRAAGRAAAVAAWVMSVLVLEIAGYGAAWEANNISITLLAIFASYVASWAAAAGARRAWWWAVALGSMAAQSYFPQALVVIGPVLWSGMALAGAARNPSDPAERRSIRRAVRVGWAVAVVAWAQPAIDVLINNGGNVRDVASQVGVNPSVGASGIPRGLTFLFSVPPHWGAITGDFARTGSASDFIDGPWLPGALVVIGLVILWYRTRSTTPSNERQLRTVTVLVVVGAAINTTLLPRYPILSFQVNWLVVATLCVWFGVAVSLGRAAQRRITAQMPGAWTRRVRLGAFAAAVVVVVAAGLQLPNRIEDVKGEPFAIDAMISPLVDETVSGLDGQGPVLVLSADSYLTEVAHDTLVANLIVRGVDVRVDESGTNYGDRRIVDRWAGPMLWVMTDLGPVKPDGKRLAAASLPGWSRARYDELAAEVSRRALANPPIELASWLPELLPRYLAGWISEDTCGVVEEIRQNRYPLESLPPGLLLALYGDQAITAPALPADLQAEATALLGRAPLEVWQVDRPVEASSTATDLVRDGSVCPEMPGFGTGPR